VTWSFNIYNTQTGTHELTLPEPSGADWNARLSGKGIGRHAFPLYGAGVSRDDIRELTRGNTYTITQEWGDHVAYAGVIQRPWYRKKTRTLEVASIELRGAYFNDRMLYGVPFYHPTNSVLTLTSKSYSGAVRAVIDTAISDLGWELPIDLPADGSGSFSADWKFNDRLKVEDHLQQIEDDGCEVYLRPYKDGTALRWETIVEAPGVQLGTATELDLAGDDSPVLDLEVYTDYVRQMTGVLAFGKGGSSAPTAYAPFMGVPLGLSVRDTWVTFSDIEDTTRLQQAADTLYNVLHFPTEVMSFGLHIFPDGPEFTAPGRLLELTSTDDEYILDGPYTKRVVGLRGGLGSTVTPEVQDAS
jgi:hypothetical protein